MARRNVIFLPGHYYHVYNRGVNREPILRSKENYLFLLHRIKEHALKSRIAVVAYCLMPNHYHFLLRQESDHSISKFVQAIFNSYTKAYNKACDRTGTLFEGPFKALLIEKDSHLIHLCRYIHRNPLDASLVQSITDWPYSNYLEWMGKRSGSLVDMKFVRTHFRNPDEYERFVLEYNPPPKMANEIRRVSFEM